MKCSFDSNLKSHVAYELTCCGCSSTYVVKTCRNLATRISERQKTNSPVGQHVVECCGALTASKNKISDQCQDSKKLMNIEALHIIKDALQKIISKPQLKMEGEKVQISGQKLPAKDLSHN